MHQPCEVSKRPEHLPAVSLIMPIQPPCWWRGEAPRSQGDKETNRPSLSSTDSLMTRQAAGLPHGVACLSLSPQGGARPGKINHPFPPMKMLQIFSKLQGPGFKWSVWTLCWTLASEWGPFCTSWAMGQPGRPGVGGSGDVRVTGRGHSGSSGQWLFSKRRFLKMKKW